MEWNRKYLWVTFGGQERRQTIDIGVHLPLPILSRPFRVPFHVLVRLSSARYWIEDFVIFFLYLMHANRRTALDLQTAEPIYYFHVMSQKLQTPHPDQASILSPYTT